MYHKQQDIPGLLDNLVWSNSQLEFEISDKRKEKCLHPKNGTYQQNEREKSNRFTHSTMANRKPMHARAPPINDSWLPQIPGMLLAPFGGSIQRSGLDPNKQ